MFFSETFKRFFDQELSHIFDRKVKRLLNRGPVHSPTPLLPAPIPLRRPLGTCGIITSLFPSPLSTKAPPLSSSSSSTSATCGSLTELPRNPVHVSRSGARPPSVEHSTHSHAAVAVVVCALRWALSFPLS